MANHGRRYISGVKSASGDNTLIAAPGAGEILVIYSLKLQNETDVATTMIVKEGTVERLRHFSPATSGGDDAFWSMEDDPMELGAGTALTLNLSAANATGYVINYETRLAT